MHKNIFTAVLKGFFTVVYFLVFLLFIGRIFSHTLSAFTDILSVLCMILALLVSAVLAEFTVKKIEDIYKQ